MSKNLYDLVLFYQPPHIRHLVEDGVVHLVVVKLPGLSQVFHEVLRDTSEKRQDRLVGKELLVNFLHRDRLRHDLNTNLSWLCHLFYCSTGIAVIVALWFL